MRSGRFLPGTLRAPAGLTKVIPFTCLGTRAAAVSGLSGRATDAIYCYGSRPAAERSPDPPTRRWQWSR